MAETNPISYDLLIHGECDEITWNEGCPSCGELTKKLMWNKYTKTVYCLDCRCTGWSRELQRADTDIIKDMSLDLLELRHTEEYLIRTMQDIKTTCILEVEAEWEFNKDKTLSNATKRGVEVDLRLSNGAEYMTASEKQEELHTTIRRDQIELEFQQREFQRQMRE